MSESDPNERLLKAVEAEDQASVSAALEHGADPNSRFDEADDVLGVAVLTGNGEIVQQLLTAGANPNARRWDGTSALYWAAKQSRPDILKQLLTAGARVEAELDRENTTSVHQAAEQDNIELLFLLLGADGVCALNYFDYLSRTPLMVAVQKGNAEAARFLLNHGADVNAHDELRIGNTALHDAVVGGNYAMVKLLIDAGADPHIEGWMRLTPLQRAVGRKDGQAPRILELLKTHS